jgi:hypothetical protein
MSDNLNLDMNTDIIFGAIFIALSFTSWGIIAKYLNVPPALGKTTHSGHRGACPWQAKRHTRR